MKRNNVKRIDIFELYEDLRKYIDNVEEYDDMFNDAPEGEVQYDVVREMLEIILKKL